MIIQGILLGGGGVNPNVTPTYVATYAALTALTAGSGLVDGGVYYTRSRTTNGDGGDGQWRYDSASTTTANGGTVLAIDGGGSGRFFRQVPDDYSAAWFGAVGDDATDNTAPFTAAGIAAAAAGKTMRIGAGTFICDNWAPPANLIIKGAGQLVTIIKRPNSAPSTTSPISLAVVGVEIEDLQVDGNKANNATNGSQCIQVTGGGSYKIRNLLLKNAKSVAGYGGGIVFSATSDDVNNTHSFVENCRVEGCDGDGILVQKAKNITINNNVCTGNLASGISVANYASPLENNSQGKTIITNNRTFSNSQNGIQIAGTSVDTLMPPVGTTQAHTVIVQGNESWGNNFYGIAAQGNRLNVSGNICYSNGNDGGGRVIYAGILFNAFASVCSGNICNGNEFYGIDAGGSYASEVVNNSCSFNGTATSGSGCGINIGGSVNTKCTDNLLNNNGGQGSANGTQISCFNYETNGGTGGLPYSSNNIAITDNTIVCTGSTQAGIWVHQGGLYITVKDNTINGTTPERAVLLETDSLLCAGNRLVDGGNIGSTTINSAATLVIPDWLEEVVVAGTTDITSGISSFSQNTYNQKVAWLTITNQGSGYTSAPTVSFSGGGGTGAAATAYLGYGGKITAVRVTNPGSGYTSAPTVTLTGGGGTGAAMTATVGVANRIGRKLTLVFADVLRLAPAGGVYLADNKDYITASTSTITLLGLFGSNWHETGRGAVVVDTYLRQFTAADIASVGNVVNTLGKYAGRIVHDTTNNRIMVSSGVLATSPWWVADGSASVTPS